MMKWFYETIFIRHFPSIYAPEEKLSAQHVVIFFLVIQQFWQLRLQLFWTTNISLKMILSSWNAEVQFWKPYWLLIVRSRKFFYESPVKFTAKLFFGNFLLYMYKAATTTLSKILNSSSTICSLKFQKVSGKKMVSPQSAKKFETFRKNAIIEKGWELISLSAIIFLLSEFFLGQKDDSIAKILLLQKIIVWLPYWEKSNKSSRV